MCVCGGGVMRTWGLMSSQAGLTQPIRDKGWAVTMSNIIDCHLHKDFRVINTGSHV